MTFDKMSIIIEQIKELKRVHGKNILSSSRPLVMQYCNLQYCNIYLSIKGVKNVQKSVHMVYG